MRFLCKLGIHIENIHTIGHEIDDPTAPLHLKRCACGKEQTITLRSERYRND